MCLRSLEIIADDRDPQAMEEKDINAHLAAGPRDIATSLFFVSGAKQSPISGEASRSTVCKKG